MVPKVMILIIQSTFLSVHACIQIGTLCSFIEVRKIIFFYVFAVNVSTLFSDLLDKNGRPFLWLIVIAF
jgi:hypothetical protein